MPLQHRCKTIGKKPPTPEFHKVLSFNNLPKCGFAMKSPKTSKNGFDRVVSDESGIHPYIGSLH